jgi:beta-lactamase regulating signal transducer with metallopeptidase domain
MNPVQVLLHQPWVARLGWTLLHFLWQGAVIAALFAVFRGRSTAAPWRYFSSCVALVAMTLAPLITFVILASADTTAAAGQAVVAVGFTSGGEALPSLPLTVWERISPTLGVVWLAGVVCFALRLLGGWAVTARLRTANTKPAPPLWIETLERLSARVGVSRLVSLRISSRMEAPAVIGWLRPVILVPVGALAGLPAAQVEALLAHELAHVRRHDYFVNLLQSMAEALLFYHPAVWWVSQQIRAEREHCCDLLAVEATGGDVLSYARALAEWESCRPAHAHAMAVNGGSLQSRIRRLVEPSRPRAHTLQGGGAAWALSALLLVAIGGAALHGADGPAAQEPAVNNQAIWTDTVKQGDIKIRARGLGTLTSANLAEAKFAGSQAVQIAAGQAVEIQFRNRTEITTGQVQAVRPGLANGLATVDVTVLTPLPAGILVGEPIDTTITVGTLSNVLYVGRPVFGNANREGTLFKLDPDGRHATRVTVQFGGSSVDQIEIKSGLQPGDRVILSSMAAYQKYDRIAIQ